MLVYSWKSRVMPSHSDTSLRQCLHVLRVFADILIFFTVFVIFITVMDVVLLIITVSIVLKVSPRYCLQQFLHCHQPHLCVRFTHLHRCLLTRHHYHHLHNFIFYLLLIALDVGPGPCLHRHLHFTNLVHLFHYPHHQLHFLLLHHSLHTQAIV